MRENLSFLGSASSNLEQEAFTIPITVVTGAQPAHGHDRACALGSRPMPATPDRSTCPACGAAVADAGAMLYTKAGDLVCDECHASEQRADAAARLASKRTGLIVGSAATAAALGTFALFVYYYADKTYVYVKTGGDASYQNIKVALSFSLIAAMVVGLLVGWALEKARRGKP